MLCNVYCTVYSMLCVRNTRKHFTMRYVYLTSIGAGGFLGKHLFVHVRVSIFTVRYTMFQVLYTLNVINVLHTEYICVFFVSECRGTTCFKPQTFLDTIRKIQDKRCKIRKKRFKNILSQKGRFLICENLSHCTMNIYTRTVQLIFCLLFS